MITQNRNFLFYFFLFSFPLGGTCTPQQKYEKNKSKFIGKMLFIEKGEKEKKIFMII